jgi:glutamate carboxypeptidase
MGAVLARRVSEYLREHRQALVEFLERLALAESPSTEPEAQKEVLGIISKALAESGFAVYRIRGRRSGGHLYARPGTRERHTPVQLLLGHCDTVWPLGTLEVMPVEVQDDVIRGPSVYDMKGGLAQMVFALRALQDLDLRPSVTPVV